MKGSILIIDDEEQLRKLLTRIISLEGFTVREAGNLKTALEILERLAVDVILCDVRLPDGNGVEFIKTAKKQFPSSEIILLTAFGNIPDGVQAIKHGAFDYIVKGNDNDRIIPLMYEAIEQVRSRQQTSMKTNEDAVFDFGSIIGKSNVIKEAIGNAQRIAATDSTVLLLGETGTGKEVFANAIHLNSKRRRKPIVAVNCSAFNKELLESELFGHKAGAFTGATKDKMGLIELAAGGTLFLDEIGDMNIELQGKLLRVLENKEFIKVGDTKISRADIRIIAATNKDLQREVLEKSFREDLYYRLNVFRIDLPPLRNRIEDIPALAEYFLKQFSITENRTMVTPAREALELLQAYSWNGNLRELKNTLERGAILADGPTILPQHLPYEIQRQHPPGNSALSLAAIEKQHIEKILIYTKGNKARASRILQIGLATLYRKLEEYGISSDASK